MHNILPAHTRIPGPSIVLCAGTQNKNSTPQLDGVFFALGNHTRRRLFELLCHNEYQIVNLLEITNGNYQGVRAHLVTLEAYGLIKSYKDGKERYYYANPTSLQGLLAWSSTMDSLLSRLS